MEPIRRDPESASGNRYDLIIVGGGVYGIMLAMEASRRNLCPLLLERDDFGGATSANSLRIVHGGLRYLQELDLHRFRESVSERDWFLRSFPSLVVVLPCLMPLYGNGLRRPFVLRMALQMNDWLSGNHKLRVDPHSLIHGGSVITPEKAGVLFPMVSRHGLKGGAVWHDAFMPDPQRILIGLLRWACFRGATALNYVEARDLVKAGDRVAGITALDRETGRFHEFRSGVVVNAAGPWSRILSRRFDRDYPELYRKSIAWNVLLNRESLSKYGLAVAPRGVKQQTYFLLPWKGKIIAGTGHASCSNDRESPVPSVGQVEQFLGNLNVAIPGLDAGLDDILRIYAGFLPVKTEGGTTLTNRELILDHGTHVGPKGLFSVSGIKFTTARLVAEKTLRRIFPGAKSSEEIREDEVESSVFRIGRFDYHWMPGDKETGWVESLRRIIDRESVVHLDDLLFRRTSLGDNPDRVRRMAAILAELFSWNEERRGHEVNRVESILTCNGSMSCESRTGDIRNRDSRSSRYLLGKG